MRKKVDERIRTLIENGVKMRHRSMFVIVGDKSRDQIVNLHYMLTKSVVKSKPSVLWCYKNKLEVSSHKKKRQKQIKKLKMKGLLDPEKVDPFSLFLETGGITYCLYKDSERILGNTFGMCILQDFEAVTPNLLARTIETVEGGGLIVLLLRSLSSLTSLYTMVMDVHDRFRTESHSQATGRFNERFLLSLASCKSCIVMDDELNILPISSHMKSIAPVSVQEDSEGLSEAEQDLKHLKEQLNDDYPVGPLLKKCCTLDQGNAIITFLDSILDKTLRSTVALIAPRGRGKSAALGLAIAGAVAAGYSNIFVTAPSPENLKTLFEFVCKGLDLLEYKVHTHYELKSDNPEFKKTLVQINIFKHHRQTIQYIQPHEHAKLSQVELLVIDEAAAIPLPIVKSLLGPYLVFLSSTVNGYEGTGRSLSLKLLQQLKQQSQMSSKSLDGASGQTFKEIDLKESIRYASGDSIESWLNDLLCLDVTSHVPSIRRLPHPTKCDLYYVNRDTLFSYNKDSEVFLQRMMALYVASHYKNSPNDLQLMADAPAHHLFVLLGPVDESKNQLPDVLCVIQVCLEGQISRKSAIRSLSEGHQPFGDQIPWKFCEQFQDTVFPSLSGARIVRIATHPSAMRAGYGSVAVELLARYFEGHLAPFSEEEMNDLADTEPTRVIEAAEKASLLEENIRPRSDLPPLLESLHERRPEKLQYLGVSFGLTQDLFRFWRRNKFAPFYIGHIPNNITGEHTCMMLKPLADDGIEYSNSDDWGFFGPFYKDYRRRFVNLLSLSFRSMDYKLAMSVLDPKINFSELDPTASSLNGSLQPNLEILSPYDMKRLEAYTNNRADFHMILDCVPVLARQYFLEKLPITLSSLQASVLLCIGLQDKDISDIEEEIKHGDTKLGRQEILSLLIKTMKKFYKYLNGIATKEIDPTANWLKKARHEIYIDTKPQEKSVDDDLNEGAERVKVAMNAKRDVPSDPESLQQERKEDKQKNENKKKRNDNNDQGSKSKKKRKS
ncbi:RNA processing factor [Lithospermum erythrorhizon]|uniref:RNA cytidine acetyltransferase n=1 Tax=Lithospermum erythrorhizon TaxID=34254 RepID=A0AAV3NZH9_LITER